VIDSGFRIRPENLQYPLLVKSETEVIAPNGPPPYSSDNNTGNLRFPDDTTNKEWRRLYVWLQEQEE
jgi:hypothetical protein